jgi:myosin heavy subunit
MPFPFTVQVVANLVTGNADSKQHAWYTIRVTSLADRKVFWELNHRYSHFKTLHQALAKIRGVNLPSLPSTKLVRTLDAQYLNKKMGELNDYIQDLSRIPQITDTEDFVQFLVDSSMLSTFNSTVALRGSEIKDLMTAMKSTNTRLAQSESKRETDYVRIRELTQANIEVKSRLTRVTNELEAQSSLLRIRETSISTLEKQLAQTKKELSESQEETKAASAAVDKRTQEEIATLRQQLEHAYTSSAEREAKLKHEKKLLVRAVKAYKRMEQQTLEGSIDVPSSPTTAADGATSPADGE